MTQQQQGGFGPGFSTGFEGGGAVYSLGGMIFRIAAELGSRFDLAGLAGSANQSRPNAEAIRNAINTAISIYQKQRFRFNEIDPSAPTMFQTVGGRATYNSDDCPAIGSMYWIDYINIQIGNTLMQLSQVNPERQHLNIQLFTQFGLPTSFAYEGNTLILYPVPVAAYNVWIGGHLRVEMPQDDGELNNPWMQPEQGELLIRSRAKYEIALHVLRNPSMAQAMSPDEPGATWRAFRILKGEGNKITSTRGRVVPMKF
jgi:hypothetical protein